jgi:hypothetical protein
MKYEIELVMTPRGKQIAYIVQNGERIAVSKKPVTAEEAVQLLKEQGLCPCGGMLFTLHTGELFCLNHGYGEYKEQIP